MLDHTLLARLRAAGLPIQRHRSETTVGWFVGKGSDVGPYATAEEALVAGVHRLRQLYEAAVRQCEETEAEVERLTQQLADHVPLLEEDDEPPQAFRKLLG